MKSALLRIDGKVEDLFSLGRSVFELDFEGVARIQRVELLDGFHCKQKQDG